MSVFYFVLQFSAMFVRMTQSCKLGRLRLSLELLEIFIYIDFRVEFAENLTCK